MIQVIKLIYFSPEFQLAPLLIFDVETHQQALSLAIIVDRLPKINHAVPFTMTGGH